jgi:tetratricopeptide (TPR) repeat protein
VKTLALLLVASTAVAQPKTAPDKFTKAAGDAFTAALAADKSGDLRVALALYQKAYAISPHPSTMFNIADVERRLGNLELAIKSYETYLAMDPVASDRAQVEKTLETLYQTPGTLVITTLDATSAESLDLPAAYALIDGELKKKPGPVEMHKIRKIPVITLTVPPGEHVVDLVTPLTYATRECEVGPGETHFCELQARPRIDGNVVISATTRRIEIKQDRRGNNLTYKRSELPAGSHRLIVTDRDYGCAPITVKPATNVVAYSFLRTTEYDRLKRCRTLDLKQLQLPFDP